MTLAAALALGAAACDDGARRELAEAVESASDALDDLEDRISDEARPLLEDARARLGEIESDLEAAEDLAADEARDAYGDLQRRVADLRADLETTAGEAREVWDRVRSALEELEARVEQALDDVG